MHKLSINSWYTNKERKIIFESYEKIMWVSLFLKSINISRVDMTIWRLVRFSIPRSRPNIHPTHTLLTGVHFATCHQNLNHAIL